MHDYCFKKYEHITAVWIMGYRDIDCASYTWILKHICFFFGNYPQDKIEEFYSCINEKPMKDDGRV